MAEDRNDTIDLERQSEIDTTGSVFRKASVSIIIRHGRPISLQTQEPHRKYFCVTDC